MKTKFFNVNTNAICSIFLKVLMATRIVYEGNIDFFNFRTFLTQISFKTSQEIRISHQYPLKQDISSLKASLNSIMKSQLNNRKIPGNG